MNDRRALAMAALWACVVGALLYPMLRAIQYVLFPEANPATVVWSAHAGYFWRVIIVGFAAGMTAFVTFMIARRDPDHATRGLLPALTVAAAAIVAQGALLP
jgi:hypothetical protein